MVALAIPASQLVSVNPGVISAAGDAIDIIGLFLTTNTRVPIGQVISFPNALAVEEYFGGTSQEAAEAAVYFLGFDNSNSKPGAMLFTQYPWAAAVPAYLRGGNIGGLTLAQLQAIPAGTLTIQIDGETFTSSSINLSSATSFSNAASIIQSALGAYDAVVTGAIAGTTLTVSAVASGTLEIGQVLSGSGITAGTTITAFNSGTGGTGTYTVAPSQTVSSTSISAGPALVTFDSTSGGFVITGGTPGTPGTIAYPTADTLASNLLLTQATGAVISQGAPIATPAAFMNNVTRYTQNWASFTTLFAPVTADKVAFAGWTSAQNNRYIYAMWDTDITVTEPNPTASAGYQIQQNEDSGTILIYEPSNLHHAAFVMGSLASIDFTQTNGRVTLAYRKQAGLTPAVTDGVIAQQLIQNGYNFYGEYSTANENFNSFQPGSITGEFLWADSYTNEVWLTAQLQLALLTLLQNTFSIPYNQEGYDLIAAACNDPITAALNFGAIRTGVTLSAAEASEVNNQAGVNIAPTLQNRGWYLQVQDASPSTRVARQSPPITLWYTDGQSVQQIALASFEIQ